MVPTRLTLGTACLSSSRHLPTISGSTCDVNPVMLPPGRPKLVTSPLVTGSPAPMKTMGMVLVACLAARAASVGGATMTSTWSATSSAASAGEPLDLPLGISVFDHDGAALDVPKATQSLTEGL